ncbi:MAG: CinA family protein [Coriobacteriales bacterium]|nr:CinA family protein [Coriobacteriales bacterium]
MSSERGNHPSQADLEALSAQVIREATARGLTVGTAESCTGGLVCAALTSVPGSSDAVRGSVVSYAVAVKEQVLGVSTQITRDEHVGVVSVQCATQMARGARRVLGCDVAVSTTGIAGPGGAEPGKPVGTVCFAVDSPAHCGELVAHFDGNREQVRAKAVRTALSLLLEALRSS